MPFPASCRGWGRRTTSARRGCDRGVTFADPGGPEAQSGPFQREIDFFEPICHKRRPEASQGVEGEDALPKEGAKMPVTKAYNPFREPVEADPSDENLVERAKAGDRAALEELVRRHQGWIFNIVVRMV